MRSSTIWAQGGKEVLGYFPLRLVVTFLLSSFLLGGLSAQGNSANARGKESERAAAVRALNNSVLQLHGQLQQSQSGAAGVRDQAAGVLSRRAVALQSLIQENPRAALSFAFSPELLADLSEKFPQAASLLESHA